MTDERLYDDDNPEWTEEDFKRALRPDQLPPEMQAIIKAAFPKTKIGRPKAAVTKVPVKLRLDRDVLASFKATGPGWQTRMNDALKDAARHIVAAPRAEKKRT